MKELLCSYTMTYDDGFAPNPYHGILTLATCKPAISRSKRIDTGVWIAGWAGRRLQQKGERELIYLAKISKKIPLGEYYIKYREKHPFLVENSYKDGEKEDIKRYKEITELAIQNPDIAGDNIYKYNSLKGKLEWQPNNFHPSNCAQHDINGENAIICNEFYYFGGNKDQHLLVPEEINVKMPKRYSAYTEDTPMENTVTKFIKFVRSNAHKATIKRNEYESNI